MRDTIDMAREAGFERLGHDDDDLVCYPEELEAFAELVRADERNRTWTQEHWTEYEQAIVQAEREACAVIAETPISGEQDDITMQAKDRVAEAIRARGNT
jgi:hypothetical protein